MSDTPVSDMAARKIGACAARWKDGSLAALEFANQADDLLNPVRDLERENAALRADKERLDWCDCNDMEITKYKSHGNEPAYVEVGFYKKYDLLDLYIGIDCRDAIDAARKARP